MNPTDSHHAFDVARADTSLAEDEVLFFPYLRTPPQTIPRAAFFAPGSIPSDDERSVFEPATLVELDRQADRYRVACWLGLPDPVVLPVVRHELEHVCQWKLGGGKATFDLALSFYTVLDQVGYRDLPGNGLVYNMNPIETDANGAAARLMRERLGGAEADRLAAEVDPGLFRGRPEPEPYETLALRLLCFAAIWPDETEQYLGRRDLAPAALFDRLHPGGQTFWQRLRADPVLARCAADVRSAVPAHATLTAAASIQEGWRPTRDAIIAAMNRSRELAGLPPVPDDPDWARPATPKA